MKKITLSATTANGVYKSFADEDPNADFLEPASFRDALSTLEKNTIIHTQVCPLEDAGFLKALEKEYGISE